MESKINRLYWLIKVFKLYTDIHISFVEPLCTDSFICDYLVRQN